MLVFFLVGSTSNGSIVASSSLSFFLLSFNTFFKRILIKKLYKTKATAAIIYLYVKPTVISVPI